MRVKKTSFHNPGYPSRRQFLAALGIGAFASASQAEGPPRLLGVPPPPPRQAVEEFRLMGDIAVLPVFPPATNEAVRLRGEPPAVTNGVPVPDPLAPGATNTSTHVVGAGDTLIGIARKRLGDPVRWVEIQELNRGIDPQKLVVGTVLVLPPLVLVPPKVETPPVPPGGIRVVPAPAQPIRTLGRPANLPRQSAP